MRKRKRAKETRPAKFYLLYRREGFHKVWVYEYLQKHEIGARERNGWKIIS